MSDQQTNYAKQLLMVGEALVPKDCLPRVLSDLERIGVSFDFYWASETDRYHVYLQYETI